MIYESPKFVFGDTEGIYNDNADVEQRREQQEFIQKKNLSVATIVKRVSVVQATENHTKTVSTRTRGIINAKFVGENFI